MEPHPMILLLVLLHKVKLAKAMTSDAFTHECHDHNDREVTFIKHRVYITVN